MNIKSTKSIRDKLNKKIAKCFLFDPYKITWPPLESTVQTQILNYLKKAFKLGIFKRIKVKKIKKKCEKTIIKLSTAQEQELENQKFIRSQLAMGLQEVTRKLEQNQMRLIIIDRSSPWQLHRHLIQISALRNCSAVAIDNLSDILAPHLGITRLCVIGFKTHQSMVEDLFAETIKHIIPLCPTIEIPWKQCHDELLSIKLDHEQLLDNKVRISCDNDEYKEKCGLNYCLKIDKEKTLVANDISKSEQSSINSLKDGPKTVNFSQFYIYKKIATDKFESKIENKFEGQDFIGFSMETSEEKNFEDQLKTNTDDSTYFKSINANLFNYEKNVYNQITIKSIDVTTDNTSDTKIMLKLKKSPKKFFFQCQENNIISKDSTKTNKIEALTNKIKRKKEYFDAEIVKVHTNVYKRRKTK